jgi:mannonate dehydratase
MKLGLGLYRQMLTQRNYNFAKQLGVTHIIAHLVDYFKDDPRLPGKTDNGWGATQGRKEDWSVEKLRALKDEIEASGLTLAGIENFDPIHWHDVLLDGPKRDEQIDFIKTIIRNMGEVGIPVMGYNFSIAGVWGWRQGPFARGGAESVGLVESDIVGDHPIPNGMVWNMIYDQDAPEGFLEPVTHEQLWQRVEHFLSEIIPVAEEAGVKLAAHPDDPPMPTMRGHARLIHQPKYYDRLFNLVPSAHNTAEFCAGTVSEMGDNDIYDIIDRYSKRNKIGYVHMRNVVGSVPNYNEVFIDEGDIDILRVLEILHKNNYQGVITPDHTPQMDCEGSWHAGMAYAIGYLKAGLKQLEKAGE